MSKENILKRTRYEIIRTDGTRQMSDWAQVITTKGTMVEPFTPWMSGQSAATAYDPADDAIRTDEVVQIPAGREKAILTGNDQQDLVEGGQAIHGGNCWPLG